MEKINNFLFQKTHGGRWTSKASMFTEPIANRPRVRKTSKTPEKRRNANLLTADWTANKREELQPFIFRAVMRLDASYHLQRAGNSRGLHVEK